MTLYHSGLSADVDVVLRSSARKATAPSSSRAIRWAATSRLKLAGDYGRDAPTTLKAIAAVSPVMDLPRCVDALERPFKLFYQWNFVRNLKARMRRKAAAFPGRFSTEALDRDPDRARSSTRHTRRRSSASAMPPTTTIAPAALRVVERIEVPDADHRRRRRSVRAVRLVPPVRQSPAIRTSRCA